MINKLTSLINYLNDRTKEYDEGNPTISDKEWDDKYFELVRLENESGIYLENSPTQNISYKVVNSLEKVNHNHKMLSLNKTKDIEEVKQFLGNMGAIAMLKMDGLTCSLSYENGKLVKAETRGDGIIGENILHNAIVINSIPNIIPYKGNITIDGEIICTKQNFVSFEDSYKNPRNFAAGSIRLLDSKECKKRNLGFVAWDVIYGLDDINEVSERLEEIADWGFTIVPYTFFWSSTIEDTIPLLTFYAEKFGYPIDGIVFKVNNIPLGKTLGETSHHFKNAIAFKFCDETEWTKLRGIEWTMGRTGVLTPVAIFNPVELDGSIIERASIHNISILKELFNNKLPYIGQEVEVFKSNMIIPQIKSSKREDEEAINIIEIPVVCPVCGESVIIKRDNESEFLYCSNPNCEGKLANKINHFCGKKGLDIKGLSKATIEKLIDWEWITCCEDVFKLKEYRNQWIQMPGFGQKSVDNILAAIEEARYCELNSFISSLGIPLIGATVSKFLGKKFEIWEKFITFIEEGNSFEEFDGFGPEMNNALTNFNYVEADRIYNNYIHILIPKEEETNGIDMNGMVFVVTGKLTHFKNRDELKSKIEACGGKVAGSISSKTNYLINNDVSSNSSKNVSAKKLNVPIISEKDFLDLFKI